MVIVDREIPEKSFTPLERRSAKESVVECADRNRHTFNGDIGYPCLFSLCFQLPLPGTIVTYATLATRVWTTILSALRDKIEKTVREGRKEGKKREKRKKGRRNGKNAELEKRERKKIAFSQLDIPSSVYAPAEKHEEKI